VRLSLRSEKIKCSSKASVRENTHQLGPEPVPLQTPSQMNASVGLGCLGRVCTSVRAGGSVVIRVTDGCTDTDGGVNGEDVIGPVWLWGRRSMY
jgi:hypothetical protein